MQITIAYKEFLTTIKDDEGNEILRFKDENCSFTADSTAVINVIAGLMKQIAAQTEAIKRL